MKGIKNEWLKTKGTISRYLVLILPIVYSGLVFLYLFARQNVYSESLPVVMFTLYFELLNVSLTMISAIVVALTIEKEYETGRFSQLLNQVSREKVIFQKMCFYLLILFFCIMASLGTYLLLSVLLLDLPVDWYQQMLQTGTVIFLAHSSYLFLYVMLSFSLGLVATTVVGTFGVLSSVLIGGTGLGTMIWKYVPFAWCEKVVGLVTNRQTNEIKELILLSVGMTVVGYFLLTIWFHFWEGRKNSS